VQATQQAAQPQRVQQLTGSQYQSLTPQQQQQYLQYQTYQQQQQYQSLTPQQQQQYLQYQTYQQQQQYQSLTPQQQQQYQQILQIRRMQQRQQPSCQPQQQCSAEQAPAPAQQAALTWQEYCAAEGTGTVCIGQMACNGLVGPWLVMLRAWLSW
jgi:classical protein kinase C